MASGQNGQSILFLWLNLLGWQIEVERDGDNLIGVARHLTADGCSVRVGGCAGTRDELAFQLFQAAMKIVEARGKHPRLLAA